MIRQILLIFSASYATANRGKLKPKSFSFFIYITVKTLEFEVKEHNLIATIPSWGPSYKIKFEVKFLSFENGFADYLRFTTTSQDNGNLGDSISLFLAGINQGIKSARFSTDIGPLSDPRVTPPRDSPYLNTNTWYRIEVQQFFDKAQDQVESITYKFVLKYNC